MEFLRQFLTSFTLCINDSSRSNLSPFDLFLMVLVRLRVNMDVQHLAYHFGIHSSTVLLDFYGCHVWAPETTCYVARAWRLYKAMPLTFKVKLSNCVVILDCFEIFMERPTSLMAQAQTWSNYKQHNYVQVLYWYQPTRKYCIRIASMGGSSIWCLLTEHCGILENLMHEDLILADRGSV